MDQFMDAIPVDPPYAPYQSCDPRDPSLRAFMKFASRIKPRNLCLGEHYDDHFLQVLQNFVSAWPLENVSYHWGLPHYDPLLLNVPHHHIFGPRPRLHRRRRVHVHVHRSAEAVKEVQTITYRKRAVPVYLEYNGTTHEIPPDCVQATEKDIEIVGPHGVRHCFPAFSSCVDCSFCGTAV